MNSEKLLDAIGMVDDDLLEQEKKRTTLSFGRKMAVLLAAVLIMVLSISAVAAAEGELQQWSQELGQSVQELVQSAEEAFLKVFQIGTPENPPEGPLESKGPEATSESTDPESTSVPEETNDPTKPTAPTLEYLNMVDIEGAVHAYYFASSGLQRTFDGGIYTYSERKENGGPPEEGTFWEITGDGVINVGNTRVDFVLTHGGKDFRIVFDYARLAGKICIMVWPQGLNEDPYGNGWNAVAIGDRTDVVLLDIPLLKNQDYTNDYFILNLETLEMTNLLEGIPVEELVITALYPTEDMHYVLMMGYSPSVMQGMYWICDLEEKTITDLKEWTQCDAVTEPYLLDDRTLVVSEYLGEERITVARYDLLTGEREVIAENVLRSGKTGYRAIYSRGAGGAHGLLYDEDGTVWLIDLQTGQRYSLVGLDLTDAYRIESPDGQMILFAYRQRAVDEKTGHCYPRIGILDPKTGEMKILTREISGNAEYLHGFLSSNTIVIRSSRDENGGYYLYVYEFT